MSNQKLKTKPNDEENKKKKKKLFIIFGSILGAGAIAGASVGIYFAVKPKTSNAVWYKNKSYLNSLTKKDITKEGGEIKTIKVNGLEHKVRLIGINEDKDKNGKTIHTTWEFVNLISDENGYSLATQWNDVDDNGVKSNFNYKESTIHNALNGENVDNVLWAHKEADTWSSTYKCSVLDMIKKENPEFVKALKTPSKLVSVCRDNEFKDETMEDKLFLLSPREMGYAEPYQEAGTTTYTYYSGHTDDKDLIRVKRQVNELEVKSEYAFSTIPIGSGQVYNDTPVLNYAGTNWPDSGDYMWLRSPNAQYNTMVNQYAWCISPEDNECCFSSSSSYVYDYTYAVAPAFCI